MLFTGLGLGDHFDGVVRLDLSVAEEAAARLTGGLWHRTLRMWGSGFIDYWGNGGD
jgi:hypothetical protein